MLADIAAGRPQVAAAVQMAAAVQADVLLLLGLDWDAGGLAVAALADRLAAAGADYPHRLALRPNTGVLAGADLDGDGRVALPGDGQGWGRFAGAGGMALFSRLPIRAGAVTDLTGLLWRDLPGADPPPGWPAGAAAVQRLSTTGHWAVPVDLPGGGQLTVLAFHATPPVFDGPEDRNGRRNRDEAALWLHLLAGRLPWPAPAGPVAVLGSANLDPARDEGRPEALRTLLAHPALQDPRPAGAAGLATADFSARDGPGPMRVDYVLPPAHWPVTGAGVLWPAPGDPLDAVARAASRHRPVWVELALPPGPDRPP